MGMKTQKRIGVFETNSSSTHSICIPKEDAELELPKQIHFHFGEFGWECDTLDSISEKASYLYTGLVYNDRKSDIDAVFKTLRDKDVEVTFEEPIYNTRTYKDSNGIEQSYTSSDNAGYVDHGDALGGFLDAVCSDEDKLLRFLFSPMAFIITGNDNDDEDVDISVSYEHDEYYKGN